MSLLLGERFGAPESSKSQGREANDAWKPRKTEDKLKVKGVSNMSVSFGLKMLPIFLFNIFWFGLQFFRLPCGESRWLATPKRWRKVRGNDKAKHRSC